MGEYKTVYKCQLCGTVLHGGDPINTDQEGALDLVKSVVANNDLFAGNPFFHQAPMYVAHRCPDGGAGLAQFAGFRRMD